MKHANFSVEEQATLENSTSEAHEVWAEPELFFQKNYEMEEDIPSADSRELVLGLNRALEKTLRRLEADLQGVMNHTSP